MRRLNHRLTRRNLLATAALALALGLLQACAPAVTPPANEAAAGLPAPAATKPANRPFSPSDPSAFVPAAGRPQMVEFYATW